MDWLNRLLAADAPPGTSLRSAQWTLRGVLPGWVVVLLALGFVAGCVWLYARESTKMGWPRRLLLAGLRAAALGLLAMLLARPVLLAEFAGERPRGVAVLLDNSQSLQQKDRRVSPRDRLRVAIARGQAPADASPDDPQWGSAGTDVPESATRAQVARWVHPRRRSLRTQTSQAATNGTRNMWLDSSSARAMWTMSFQASRVARTANVMRTRAAPAWPDVHRDRRDVLVTFVRVAAGSEASSFIVP